MIDSGVENCQEFRMFEVLFVQDSWLERTMHTHTHTHRKRHTRTKTHTPTDPYTHTQTQPPRNILSEPRTLRHNMTRSSLETPISHP